ncbi:MAG: hypothetical protein ACYCV7_13985, partial [Acidimicrobiales bacterium]
AQPAGALSAQLPAVGVREQNVNSAGRIRVALPNGSVNVGNLPLNSAGQLKVAPIGSGTTPSGPGSTVGFAQGAPINANGTPVVLVDTKGAGVLKQLAVSTGANPCVAVDVIIDGANATPTFRICDLGYIFGVNNTVLGERVTGSGNSSGGETLSIAPPGGLPFQHSLKVVAYMPPGSGPSSYAWWEGLYSLR